MAAEDEFTEVKRELFELMTRMHRGRLAPPVPQGLTPSEARVMVAVGELHACGADIRPGRVAELTHTTPSALSQTLKTLEEKGLIERKRESGDFRAVSVCLTEDGVKFANEGCRMRNEHMNEVMEFVGIDDMRELVRILRKIVEFHEDQPSCSCCDTPVSSGSSKGEGDVSCA